MAQAVFAAGALAVAGGCAADRRPTTFERATDSALGGVRAAEASAPNPTRHAESPADGRPAATVMGRPIEWSLLNSMLAEASGSAVIEEVSIDHLARRELERRGLTIDPADVEAEERALLAALGRSGTAPAEAGELVMQMRRTRGLGPVRYKAMLERNAMLRRLVRDECEPTTEQVTQGMEVRHGPRHVCRIIVTPSRTAATTIRARLGALPDDQRQAAFAAEAFTESADPSRDRGGLLEPISPADASYASAVRTAVAGLAANQVSPVIALDNGYAILIGVRTIPGEAPGPDAPQRVRDEIRARLERVAMDQLARRLLAESPPTVFDSSLNWSWQSRRP